MAVALKRLSETMWCSGQRRSMARMTGHSMETLWSHRLSWTVNTMAPPEIQQQPPDPAPPSLSAGGHESRDYYAAQVASRPPSQNEPYPTPYLGLRASLSQTWINRWTILLLLVLIRTIFAIASVDSNLVTARKQALSACTSAENVGSALASMPHYMSQGVNTLAAQSIEKAISGLMQMLTLTLIGVEEIVVFVINMLTQTYVCLITLAVSGGLHVAVSVAKDVGDFLNATIQDIGDDLSSAAADFQTAMNSFLSDINKLGSLLSGETDKAPTIDLGSEINKLKDIQLPSDYDQGLDRLNRSIPTFDQVNNLTQMAIRLPFEEVRKLLNESLPSYTMNTSLSPVPTKAQLVFCSDNDGVNDFFNGLFEIEHLAKNIFYAVIIVLACLAMFPMGYIELHRWRKMQERAHLIRNDAHDPLDAVYIVSRPYTAGIGLWLAAKFSTRRRAVVRWSVAYATTIPALFVLSLAVSGLLACLCQYTLLKALEKEVPALENQIVGFKDKVVTALDHSSEQWAIGTNKIIVDTNSKINDDVFGWVNTTTGAVNHTLNVFVDEMMGALNDTFGGTILYDPIVEVLNCLVLLKIEGIQRGLDWVGEHARIDISMIPNDTFSLGTAKLSDSATGITAYQPDDAASDAIGDAISHVIESLASSIRQEAVLSTCILLVWVVIVFIGIGRAIFVSCRAGETEMNHGQLTTSRLPHSTDKYELREVPTYEQATGTAVAADHSGNKYNGQSYTLTPAPPPVFEVDSATSPILHTGFSPSDEKLHTVNGRQVHIRRPTHIRASSYGDFTATSPLSPPSRQNPFSNPSEVKSSKHNPFLDPVR